MKAACPDIDLTKAFYLNSMEANGQIVIGLGGYLGIILQSKCFQG